MPLNVVTDTNPLRIDDGGAIRVGKCRVLFELVVNEHCGGATPEDIVRRFDTLELADVYAAIAFFLRHRAEVEAWLVEEDEKGRKLRETIEARQPDMTEFGARLRERWILREQSHASSAD